MTLYNEDNLNRAGRLKNIFGFNAKLVQNVSFHSFIHLKISSSARRARFSDTLEQSKKQSTHCFWLLYFFMTLCDFNEDGFQLHFSVGGLIWNTNACLCSPKYLSMYGVYSLGPSDAIWRWRSWSTLVQVMACCLTALSHYLNQCWLIISKVLWLSTEDIIITDLKIPISKVRLKITFSKSH